MRAVLVVCIVELRIAGVIVHLDIAFGLRGDPQRILEGNFFGRGFALQPVVAIAADANHDFLRRHFPQSGFDALGEPILRGDRSGLVVCGVFVVSHQHQIIDLIGQFAKRKAIVIDRHRLRNRQTLRRQSCMQLAHESDQMLLALLRDRFEVDAHSVQLPVMQEIFYGIDGAAARGRRSQHRFERCTVPALLDKVIDQGDHRQIRTALANVFERHCLLAFIVGFDRTVGAVQMHPFRHQRIDVAQIALQRHPTVVVPIDVEGDALEAAGGRDRHRRQRFSQVLFQIFFGIAEFDVALVGEGAIAGTAMAMRVFCTAGAELRQFRVDQDPDCYCTEDQADA